MKKIFVGNLDYNVSEEDIRGAFEAHGAVDSVSVVRDRETGQPRGFAFVEMPNDDEAGRAIQALNGQTLGRRPINVNEARPKTERSGGGGGRGFRGGGGYGGGGRREPRW